MEILSNCRPSCHATVFCVQAVVFCDYVTNEALMDITLQVRE
jgi:hypothetical protein